MKKIVSLVTMAAMLAVSAPAHAGHDYRRGVDHGGRQHSGSYRGYGHHHGSVSTGEAVAIGIGALLLGTVIASNNNRDTRVERVERTYPVQRQQQYVCEDVIQRDYYGNPYVAGRNCWYQ